MTEDDANRCLGHVIGVGFGWTDEVVESYIEALMKFPRVDLMERVAEQLALEWDRPSRIPMGKFTEGYKALQRQEAMDSPPALTEGGAIPSVKRGREIAANAYVQECKQQGRDPDWDFVDKLIGQVVG
jgi:hypothetical protein